MPYAVAVDFEARVDRTAHECWDRDRIEAFVVAMPGLLASHAVPGASVALTCGREIQFRSGFGVVEKNGPQVRADSIFQGASLGKPLFAHAVIEMLEEGECSIDNDLGCLLAHPLPAKWMNGLAIRELLSHSAGVVYDPAADRPVFDPSSRGTWAYSGMAYLLLQRALTRLGNRNLESIVRRHVLEPSGMGQSLYVEPQHGMAVVGHDRDGQPLDRLRWSEPNVASSLYTSAVDYGRFLIQVLSVVQSSERAAESRAPVVAVDPALNLAWGAGWAVELKRSGAPLLFHWGSNPGFKSFAMLSPDREMGLVILTNGDNGLELIDTAVTVLDPVPHDLFRFYMLKPDD